MSVVTGLLFLAALFFAPFITALGGYAPITAPALVIVGAMMIVNIRRIDWQDYSESIPSFLILIGIPFTHSIADGLAFGFILYPVIKIFAGRRKDVPLLMYVVAGALAAYFIFIRSAIQ